MNISIFGLGYVGAVSLACLARDGHRVVGVDIDPAKLTLIASGRTPVVEEGMIELMKSAVGTGRASVTADAREAVGATELSLICVGTPSAENGSQDQSAMLRLTHEIGDALRDKPSTHVVVFRSTLVPGTVDDVLTPILERASGKRAGEGFHVGYQPEFLREGSSIRDYDRPPYTIVGASDEAAIAKVRELFGHLPCEFHATSIRAAETVKYCCNNFHALKITFANETARLCEAMRVDPFEVMGLVCKDRQLNISPAYLKPGFAFGGSCLPKDLRATLYFARGHDVDLPMLASILPSNRRHVEHAIAKVIGTGKRRIGMIGLSFKTGTDDLRESPLVMLAEHFIGKGLSLLVFDQEVQLSNLLGANRNFIQAHLPHIGQLLRNDLDEVVAESDVLVVGQDNAEVTARLRKLVRSNHIVIDLANIGRERWPCRFEGLCW
ncbi:MAG TPA: nucleotide sugar dehydrogenase [Casimicrobiaceae bacterium]|nr:nucleotide sugar dehydrogenase [Casimicrobiaceae bacterium]